MTLSPSRRQYDFCRLRLYKAMRKSIIFIDSCFYQQQHKVLNSIDVKQWRSNIRNIQKSDKKYNAFCTVLQKNDPDYIQLIHLGVCALETLSGLCQPSQQKITDHSYAFWTFVCRIFYESPHRLLQHSDAHMNLSDKAKYIRSCVEKFLSEQCNISNTSACPTTITATTYRLDCLIHKLSALSCIFYKAMLQSNKSFTQFQTYIEKNCDIDPTFIISHILTAYAYLLGNTSKHIYPLRDGKCIVQLFEHLLYLSTVEPGIIDQTKNNGNEIIYIHDEIPVFITYLFGVHG
jgi:hypothetical protein